MFNRCPQCHRKIERFSVNCRACGWSLDQDLHAQAEDDKRRQKLQESPIQGHFDTAMDAIGRAQYQTALSALNTAIIDAPSEWLADCYALRGYTNLKMRQYDRAESDCTQALARRDADSETLAWRAAALGQQNKWRLAFEDLVKAKKCAVEDWAQYEDIMNSYVEPAMARFRELVKKGFGNDELFYDRGWINMNIGDLTKASRDFELALQQNPQHGLSLLGMAEIMLKNSDHESAIEYCDKALQVDPRCKSTALQTRVLATRAAGKVQESIDSLQQLKKYSRDDPSLLMDCGVLRTDIGDYVGAIEDFSALLKIDPGHIEAYLRRGEAFAATLNHASAASDYTNYLLHHPHNTDVLIKRGETNINLQQFDQALADFDAAGYSGQANLEILHGRARVFTEQKRFDEALEQCEKALRVDGEYAPVYATQGKIHFQRRKQYHDALERFSRAIELDQDIKRRAEYLYHRGATHYELEKFHDAYNDFVASSELRPNHPGTLIWQSAASARLEQWSEVIETLTTAIGKRPAAAQQYKTLGRPMAQKAIEYFSKQIDRGTKDRNTFFNRGMAYQFLGKTELAIDDYTAALNREQDVDVLVRRGQMFARKHDHASAIKDFATAIQQDPENHLARYSRAISYFATGQRKSAFIDIDQAINLSPNEAKYFVLQGEMLRDRPRKAIEAFSRAIALDYTDHVAFRCRGAMYLASKHYLKAIGDFCQSLDIFPNQPDVIALRGTAFLKNEQFEMAKEDFELALTHDEHLVKAYTGRAMVLAEMGQHEKALIWLTKAIHRFDDQQAWSQLLLTRGKVFYNMGRFLPAIADFSSILSMQRKDPPSRNAARYARAVALVQQGQLTKAQSEFQKLFDADPEYPGAKQSLKWLTDGAGARPTVLHPPKMIVRPRRPPQVSNPIEFLSDAGDKWIAPPPHDAWLIRSRTKEKKEYGPVLKTTLDQWVREGRINGKTKLLRADWRKWKRADEVFEFLATNTEPENGSSAVDTIPNINS